jgi:lipid-A-disaccharide synthase-like uncharacterized protein
MNEYVFKIFGIIGLLIITAGIFSKNETAQDKVFAIGGIFLLLYSIHLHDPIFITLQAVFILASLYEIYKLHSKNKF